MISGHCFFGTLYFREEGTSIILKFASNSNLFATENPSQGLLSSRNNDIQTIFPLCAQDI